jgi:hypothetical protein
VNAVGILDAVGAPVGRWTVLAYRSSACSFYCARNLRRSEAERIAERLIARPDVRAVWCAAELVLPLGSRVLLVNQGKPTSPITQTGKGAA